VGAWPSCYRFSTFKSSWHEAREYCSAFSANLLALDSLKEAHIIDYLLNSNTGALPNNAWFLALRFRLSVSVSVTVSVKPCKYCRSVTPFRKCRCRLRHIGEWPGRPDAGHSPRASFPRFRVNGAPGLVETATDKIELDPIRMEERKRQTYGTENVYLRKLRNFYGILYVLLQRSTEIRLRMNGNVMLGTTHK